MSADPRLAALLTPAAAQVFHGVESGHDVFRPDPFDVPAIHATPRRVFGELVREAAARRVEAGSGRMLLLLGEAGSGKTHLMRAFRQQVHAAHAGFVSYAQMTSSTSNYPRYLLRQVLESLDKPYTPAEDPERSSLDVLSDALTAIDGACSTDELRVLRETDDDALLRKTAWKVGNRLVNQRLVQADSALDQEVVFQLLFLQNRRPTVTKAVSRYLSCAPLSERESGLLGGVPSLDPDQEALPVLRSLARLTAALEGGVFALAIDQLEDAYAADEATRQSFRRMMLAVRELTDSLPNAVVVITCLSDYWEAVKGTVSQSILDRLVLDPEPLVLRGDRTAQETRAVVAARVAHALQRAGLEPDPADPTAPLPSAQLDRFATFRLRDLLGACTRVLALARERGVRPDFGWLEADDPTGVSVVDDARSTPPDPTPATPDAAVPSDAIRWTRAWDDFRSDHDAEIPDDEAELAALLATSLVEAAQETPRLAGIEVRQESCHVLLDTAGGRLRVGICEKQAQGGGLQKQLNQLWNKAGSRTAVLIRSTPFPSNPKTKIAQTIGEFVAGGHRRGVCPASEWKAMLAMRAFAAQHREAPGFAAWRATSRPLLSLPTLALVFGDLDEGTVAPPSATAPTAAVAGTVAGAGPEPAAARQDRSAAEPPETAALQLGATSGVRAAPVALDLQSLCRHAAFLGGTGSGKTTLALSVVEQALLRGIPALLIDRKGDLASYASDDAWRVAAERHGDRASRLQRAVDVRIYTPGDPGGRDLAIPILPEADPALPPHERTATIENSAAALVAMLNPGRAQTKANRQSTAILIAALQLLDDCGRAGTLAELIGVLAAPDQALIERIGAIDPKALPKLGSELESLKATERQLLDNGAAERLDVRAMLGLDGAQSGGRTALAVVNTAALGQEARIQFLVTCVLSDLRRLAESRPSERLQALILLDEADLYLPAVGQPPTKAPLEHGLKRFRSAGLGLLLATQSPGDLDYKGRDNIGTWFVGRVTQDTALKKLESLFGRDRAAMGRVAGQKVGEFHCLRAGSVTAFRAEQSLVEAQQVPAGKVAEWARGAGR